MKYGQPLMPMGEGRQFTQPAGFILPFQQVPNPGLT